MTAPAPELDPTLGLDPNAVSDLLVAHFCAATDEADRALRWAECTEALRSAAEWLAVAAAALE